MSEAFVGEAALHLCPPKVEGARAKPQQFWGRFFVC